jgi:AraC-like DNA-binding protein
MSHECGVGHADEVLHEQAYQHRVGDAPYLAVGEFRGFHVYGLLRFFLFCGCKDSDNLPNRHIQVSVLRTEIPIFAEKRCMSGRPQGRCRGAGDDLPGYMESTFIYIKNMVCDRCIMAVRSLLQEMGLEPLSVRLGEAELSRPLSAVGRASLDAALRRLGFELIDGRRERLAEQVKTLVIELVHRENGCLRVNLSDYLAERLRHDYDYISGIFSDVEGTTVEKFFIAQKIERVKELLAYDEFSLSEIAGMLNYSSVAHLSAQFKRVTGLSPSAYKRAGRPGRLPLDKV